MRAKGNLGSGEELLHSLCHDVRRRVTQDAETLGRCLGHDLDLRAIGKRRIEADELAVNLAGNGGLGETGSDSRRAIGNGRSCLELFAGTIGKVNGNRAHGLSFLPVLGHKPSGTSSIEALGETLHRSTARCKENLR